MVITKHIFPVTHTIIDNFLGKDINQRIFDLIQQELPRFEQGQIQTNNGSIEVVEQFKRNANQWLDPFESEIVQLIRTNFFKFDVQPELNHNERSHNMLLSRYVDGDFYNWHTDLGGHCTWNYFVAADPKDFTGGDFILSDARADEDPVTNTTIEPINDRLVIFPAQYKHCVTPIVGPGIRYSIQVFFA